MSTIERFLSKIVFDRSGCHLWIGATTSMGYGNFFLYGSNWLAHRASWELFIGNIPDDKLVLHKCDTPLCVNPDHLFLGTHKDNTQDMMSKGRDSFSIGIKSENSRTAILDWERVLLIRSEYSTESITQVELAKKYNVSIATINNIVLHKTWKHEDTFSLS